MGDARFHRESAMEYFRELVDGALANQRIAVGEFTAFYQAARAKFDSDPVFADRSRKRVVQLQAGEPETMRLWQMLVDDSMEYLRKIYARLNITLTDADMAPESFYNSMLGDVCDELESRGLPAAFIELIAEKSEEPEVNAP